MLFNLKFWLKFSFINLTIVALLGCIMRYKIGFDFPFLNQKYLLHSHSHFAFAGWVTHTLMVLMVYFLETKIKDFKSAVYKKIIITNLICAYGMLVFFIIQGYGGISIFFSTVSIFISFVFGFQYYKDLKKVDVDYLAVNWFKAAVIFNIISCIGTFYLAYMMATKNIIPDWYFSSIYYYLHFQYNGWFFFGCMGLFLGHLNLKKSEHPCFKTTFLLFVIACVPAYFLSLLWLQLPIWLYSITAISAIIQAYAWFQFVYLLKHYKIKFLSNQSTLFRNILIFIGFATSLKFLLQLGSTIPSLSQESFGFRPIVIAYLHLVFLAFVSLFLLYFIIRNNFIEVTSKFKLGLKIFIFGIVLNEVVLGIQGIASFSFTTIPVMNELLFVASLILFFSMGYCSIQVLKKTQHN